MHSQAQKKLLCFDRKACVGKTLNSDICSRFWEDGEFRRGGGGPGEISHIDIMP